MDTDTDIGRDRDKHTYTHKQTHNTKKRFKIMKKSLSPKTTHIHKHIHTFCQGNVNEVIKNPKIRSPVSLFER